MSELCQETLQCNPDDLRSALSIHTRKITDSCRDKDCIEDLRVYLTPESQALLNTSASAKVRSADLLYATVDVSPVSFNRCHYYVDLTFYYRVMADITLSSCRPSSLYGLALFSKRVVLCGENGGAHVYSSDEVGPCGCSGALPTALVEVLDPMVLSSRVAPVTIPDPVPPVIPAEVLACFDDELAFTGDEQRLYITLGQFSIIRLERDAQIIVPILDYSIPTKECCDNPGCAEDPCELFSRIPFPTKQFTVNGCSSEHNGKNNCYCSGE